MIIHFTASKGNIKEDIRYFREITRTVKELGHEIARDWVEEVYSSPAPSDADADADWKKINSENIAAIAKADIVIVEASAKSFSVGYQVAIALQQKKPTLVLTRHNSLSGTFGSGISSDLVRLVDYTDKNVDKIIADFIEENTIDTKDLRFNFFIDRQIYNYLRWASFKSGKTKAEILRELVNKEIENHEKDY